ncbi:MAG: hypothetical protein LQ352_005942 [Teloschistes flavicans]|nr:MAG: hypothetical protein LQ352_005942 [Teloschistes flavicans]
MGMTVFKRKKRQYPNYGKAVGMDASQWWAQVIESTFLDILPNSVTIPGNLVDSLLHRFSSHEGYRLFGDVIPFFHDLHKWRDRRQATGPPDQHPLQLQVGVISNSDDRVPAILSSLGLRVANRSYRSSAVKSDGNIDIDWVVLSYDVGFEKPDRRIFDVAKQCSSSEAGEECAYCHVGDNLSEDYQGAFGAGWRSILLDREAQHADDVSCNERVRNLRSVMRRLTESG